MSMTQYTVKELKEFIKDLPDDMLVVTRTSEENWIVEGMFDGLEPYLTDRLNEIRTGMIPSDGYEWPNGDVLILSDFDEETSIEWWNEHVEEKNLNFLMVKDKE